MFRDAKSYLAGFPSAQVRKRKFSKDTCTCLCQDIAWLESYTSTGFSSRGVLLRMSGIPSSLIVTAPTPMVNILQIDLHATNSRRHNTSHGGLASSICRIGLPLSHPVAWPSLNSHGWFLYAPWPISRCVSHYLMMFQCLCAPHLVGFLCQLRLSHGKKEIAVLKYSIVSLSGESTTRRK